MTETTGPGGKRQPNLGLVLQDPLAHSKKLKRDQIDGCVKQQVNCDSDALQDEGDGHALKVIRKYHACLGGKRGQSAYGSPWLRRVRLCPWYRSCVPIRL